MLRGEEPAASGLRLRELFASCRLSGQRVYGVIDAARDPELAFAARDPHKQSTRWLFSDATGPHMANVAPYLISIGFPGEYPPFDPAYLDPWSERLGHSSGILLLTRVGPSGLWTHLRQLFVMRDLDAQRFFFRFYDPRVLRTFLPVCTPEEANQFFGPIDCFLVEDEVREQMLVYTLKAGELDVRRAILGESP